MPIFSTALANSSGSTVPLLLRSKYLKDLSKTVSSLVAPVDFWASFFLSSPSKLHTIDKINRVPRDRGEWSWSSHGGPGDGRPAVLFGVLAVTLTFSSKIPCYFVSVFKILFVNILTLLVRSS